MSRLASWFRASTADASPAESQADLRAAEIANIQNAMLSAAKIMNDDIEGAEAELKTGASTFHHLGYSLTTFMRSVLGFEKEVMAEASNRLTECENRAWTELKKAQKDGVNSANGKSKIYPPGSEFALVHAEAQLMCAMVAVLHESLTEGIRGFMKLRKAFITLDGIMAAEATFLKEHDVQPSDKVDVTPTSETPSSTKKEAGDDKDLEFTEAPESLSGVPTPAQYEGHLTKSNVDGLEKELANLAVDSNGAPLEKQATLMSVASRPRLEHGPESDVFADPIDTFIHSGANMCFGVLLLMISMVPPAFSRLLSIIGFRGDRERGVKMLWQSTRFDNINGSFAGLILLAYYNGAMGFADILPSEEDVERGAVVGYPRRRCAELLATMRSRYPDSGLWRFEEARALSNQRDLTGAIKILSTNTISKMRQVAALNCFEWALDSMYVGDYNQTRDSFLRAIELNDWSHALYYYIAGCAELELYRTEFHAAEKNETQTQLHKRKAEELLRKAPTVAGKKRFMSRPLPFEQFVQRKLQKWEERSKALKLDLVDAVGASPIQEMVYLWNGGKKMQTAELEQVMSVLTFDRLTAPAEAKAKIESEADEKAVLDLCKASIYRELGRVDEARALFQGILAVDKASFKGPTKDDYAQPAASYEMAVLAWLEVRKPELRTKTTSPEATAEESTGEAANSETPDEEKEIEDWQRKKTAECQEWLDKASKWEAFVLDARVGMKVSTGNDTLRWFRKDRKWGTA
ncbi:breast cancer protein [Xylariales sp. PMI_506]|nr:breast cancer protein [Xylariales sp. PMI_506]